MLKALFSFTVLIVFAARCSQPDNGGPCEYDITTSPATVIAIQPRDTMSATNPATDSAWAEVLFLVETGGHPDTLYYTREFTGFASISTQKQYGLTVGNKFRYEHHVIKSGHCTPDYYKLKLEPFK